jgi:tryptophan-rich sensory protein
MKAHWPGDLLGAGLVLLISALQTDGLILLAVQMMLNFSLSFLFFYSRIPGSAFAEIFLLWICLLLMIVTFFRVSPARAYLQIACRLRVRFASLLNGSAWYLNRHGRPP